MKRVWRKADRVYYKSDWVFIAPGDFMKWLSLFMAMMLVFSQVSEAQFTVARKKDNNNVIIADYNLKVSIPDGWSLLSHPDWRFISAVTPSKEPTTIRDTKFGFYLNPISENFTLDDLAQATIDGKAARLGINQIINLGQPEEVDIAGLKGLAKLYLFSIRGEAYLYRVVSVKKGSIGYIADYWGLREGDNASHFESFTEWLKSGISFLDPENDIVPNLLADMVAEDAIIHSPVSRLPSEDQGSVKQ